MATDNRHSPTRGCPTACWGSFTEVAVLPYLTLVAAPELWLKDHGDGTRIPGQRSPMNDVYRIKRI